MNVDWHLAYARLMHTLSEDSSLHVLTAVPQASGFIPTHACTQKHAGLAPFQCYLVDCSAQNTTQYILLAYAICVRGTLWMLMFRSCPSG